MSRHAERLERSCVRAAVAASETLKRAFLRRGRKGFRISQKGARGELGLVTEADFAAEEKAVGVLKRAHPEMGFLTEEGSEPARMGSAGRFILDPLDGTTNFVHGFPMFCVSIGAELEGRLVAGAIALPLLGDVYRASRGNGAWLGRARIRVSGTKRVSDSLLTTGFSYRKKSILRQEIRTFQRLSLEARAVRRPGSAAIDLAYVARGVFDGFWERTLSPWDVAAGIVLVEEAGGKVTDFSSRKAPLERGEILASNGKLHSALLARIRGTLHERG